MPITRNSDQKSLTLEEFYLDITRNKALDPLEAGKQMLDLLAGINTLFPQTQLWGLTSLARLVLQSADVWHSPWYIIIGSAGMPGHFRFEYLLPTAAQPWPEAYVQGEATSLPQALRYLLIAMRECGGWADNTELAARLAEHGLTR